MNLSYEYFPQCCTGRIIGQFGGTVYTDHHAPSDTNRIGMIEALDAACERALETGCAFLTCTTNNQQEEANEVLEDYGFEGTPFMSKTFHPDTTVKLWWLCLSDWDRDRPQCV